MILILLSGALTDEQVVLLLDVLDDEIVELVAADPNRTGRYNAAQRDHSHLAGAAADVHDHAAHGLGNRKPGTDGSCHRLLDDGNLPGAGLDGGLPDSAALHRSYPRRNADNHIRAGEEGAVGDLLDEDLEHVGSDIKVGNDTILERTHCHDRTGCTTDDILGLLAHIADGIGAGIHRHHRRLPQNNALAPHEYQCVGGSQVNAYIFSERKNRTHVQLFPFQIPRSFYKKLPGPFCPDWLNQYSSSEPIIQSIPHDNNRKSKVRKKFTFFQQNCRKNRLSEPLFPSGSDRPHASAPLSL